MIRKFLNDSRDDAYYDRPLSSAELFLWNATGIASIVGAILVIAISKL